MKEFKEQIVTRMIEKTASDKIIKLHEVAEELGHKHISSQDCRDIMARLSNVEGYKLVRLEMNEKDSLFMSLALIENNIEFED